jgi:hypothetical protein
VIKLNRVRDAAVRLHHENLRLQNWVYALAAGCAVLATSLVIVLFQR